MADHSTESLNDLTYFTVGTYHVYHCPTLATYCKQDELNQKHVVLFGYASKPEKWEFTETELLDQLLKLESIDHIARYISRIVGRYSIFILINGDGYVFHDPAGLRTVYYIISPGITVFGTQPLILSEFCKLEAGYKVELFFHSNYFKNADEYWLPAGLSVYENVQQLVPNHYLRLITKKEVRYWPFEPLKKLSFDDTVDYLSRYLSDSVLNASKKIDLVLPLTSGLDSRILLASSKKCIDNIICYTRIHKKNINKYHQYISIPSKILKSFGHKHNIIIADCSVTPTVEERYKLNNSTSRFQDSVTLFSSSTEIIRNKYVMYGNVSELIKIRKSDNNYLSLHDFDIIPNGWFEIGFVNLHLEKWYDTAVNIYEEFGLHPYELFYWEHRLGNWAARAYNENDLAFDVYTPFNSRDILSTAMMLDISQRELPEGKLHRAVINQLWPEIDKYPYNKRNIVGVMKAMIRKTGKITMIDRLIFGLNEVLN